jgi:small subunit ribosomal protein S15
MARMYSRKKGRHGSKRPPLKIMPRWVKAKKREVEELVLKLAKERHNTAVIGTILRDQYSIPNVKLVAGKSVSQILRESKMYPEMPEDMLNLLKKAVNLREHLEKNRQDKLSNKGLENLESKIRRLGKYYSREGYIAKGWKYDAEQAKLIIQKK